MAEPVIDIGREFAITAVRKIWDHYVIRYPQHDFSVYVDFVMEAVKAERDRCAEIADRVGKDWSDICSDDGEEAATTIRNLILKPEILAPSYLALCA